MSSYNELVKSFEKVRTYMRDFYLYGIRRSTEYNRWSSKTYDDERRRLEIWLGSCMCFVRRSDGKSVFISIDSRSVGRDPLYKAWKSKSFTVTVI